MADHKDRTHIARMGFADPDKRNPLHDWGSLYMAGPGATYWLNRLANEDLSSTPLAWKRHSDPDSFIGPADDIRVLHTEIEKKLFKENSKSLIGFADAVIDYQMICVHRNDEVEKSKTQTIGVEVKITPSDGGSIVRQISMYEMSSIEQWMVVTSFNPAGVIQKMCDKQGIICVQLDKHFEDWLLRQGHSK